MGVFIVKMQLSRVFSQATSRNQIRRENASNQELAISYTGLTLHAAQALLKG